MSAELLHFEELQRTVKLSSPEKVLMPATETQPQVTKRDLANYLIQVAEPFLRLNADRPMTLQRFPDGITGEEFFSKRPPRGTPEFVRTVMCTYPSGRKHEQLVLDEPAALAWAAQLGTITFHPWPVRTAQPDNPDELRIDLDPQPGRDFGDAVVAALGLRDLLAELGLQAYAKTSGNRGIHVFAPISADHEFQIVRHAVIGIARELERRMPELVTASWWKEERGERVFVDFNQANRDRTLAAAYSPRPLPGAPVSTPVTWEELTQITPAQFTIHTVPRLLAQRPCPWDSLPAGSGDLGPALALWEADLERGLGELNFPPDYPKMPGEPPRVPPSKRKADRVDSDYLAPKQERDAHWATAIVPPFGPMLAKPVKKFPVGDYLYEPKWDGFRAIIWRSGSQVEIGSRNSRPMTRYFPELVAAVQASFPDPSVIDGEIIMIDPEHGDRLNFDALQQRIHPAASRISKLSVELPASFVAFDLLALGSRNFTLEPFEVRRQVLAEQLAGAVPPIHLTPTTRDPELAKTWFEAFEGAGLDGVIAKSLTETYQEDKRVMLKIKHERTADCVVAGYRLYRDESDAIGSLLLGLYDESGQLQSVGVIGAFPMARRQELFVELQPLVVEAGEEHPWRNDAEGRTPTAAAKSRWSASKDLSFTALRPERVVEVRYDHMEGPRFRHTAQFVRWRPDRDPASCGFAQLEEPVSYDLREVLGNI